MSLKAANQAEAQLKHAFPDLGTGQWNCRHIGGNPAKPWSQHAWGAGLDITHDDYGYSTHPDHQEWLDGVYGWLDKHREALSIKQILWRVRDHFNHIHIDMWPTNINTPPCDGGQTDQRGSNGEPLTPGKDHGPENGYIDGWLPPPTSEDEQMLIFTDWANGMFDHFSDEEIAQLYDAGYIVGGERDKAIAYWVAYRDLGSEGRTVSQRSEVARFIQTSTVSAWLTGADTLAAVTAADAERYG